MASHASHLVVDDAIKPIKSADLVSCWTFCSTKWFILSFPLYDVYMHIMFCSDFLFRFTWFTRRCTFLNQPLNKQIVFFVSLSLANCVSVNWICALSWSPFSAFRLTDDGVGKSTQAVAFGRKSDTINGLLRGFVLLLLFIKAYTLPLNLTTSRSIFELTFIWSPGSIKK